MKMQVFKIMFLLIAGFLPGILYAQDGMVKQASASAATNNETDLTVIYDIKVQGAKEDIGIEETYNGGIKTYMQSGSKVRIRMVSLMRIQNIFLSKNSNGSNRILISKESGKQKYKQLVSDAAWKQLNSRYQNLHCSFTKDSVLIAGYYCKKANIQLADGKRITAYFTNALPPADKNIEPMFACLPGMVLKYEYKQGNGSLIYHAVKVKHNPISETVFREPGNEYPLKATSN